MSRFDAMSMTRKPLFEKIADYELPEDYSLWQDEIMKNFFAQFNTLPQQFPVDLVISNIDENRGYAKGSVVVGSSNKRINFPVIVRDFMLAPFDVFITPGTDGKEPTYEPATVDRIEEALQNTELGTPSVGPYSSYDESISLKRPGGIPAKVAVISEDIQKFSSAPSWRDGHIEASDMKLFIEKIAAEPSIPENFSSTGNGNMLNEIVQLPTESGHTGPVGMKGKLDFNDVVKARQAVTMIDAEVFDTKTLIPIEPGNACELRIKRFPSMEKFLEVGDAKSISSIKTDMGTPMTGIVISADSASGWDTDRTTQVFIAANGGSYCSVGGFSKPEDGSSLHPMSGSDSKYAFYGSDIGQDQRIVEAIANSWRQAKQPWFMSGHVADRSFVQPDHGVSSYHDSDSSLKPSKYRGLLAIYKDGGKYSGLLAGTGFFKQKFVNGNPVYVCESESTAFICAAVRKAQRVSKVEGAEYKVAIGKLNNIFLIPADSIILNLGFMRELDSKEFLKPSHDIRKLMNEMPVEKTTVDSDEKQAGFILGGPSVTQLYTVLGLEKNASLSAQQAIGALHVVGVDKDSANYALLKCAEYAGAGKPQTISIYGTRSDYIDPTAFNAREKTASTHGIRQRIGEIIKTDLIKAASLISDPEAVDAMLSLNFINSENLKTYITAIPKIESVVEQLSGLLVASRMGLQQIDEAAVKAGIDGLDKALKGLREVKTSIGE